MYCLLIVLATRKSAQTHLLISSTLVLPTHLPLLSSESPALSLGYPLHASSPLYSSSYFRILYIITYGGDLCQMGVLIFKKIEAASENKKYEQEDGSERKKCAKT